MQSTDQTIRELTETVRTLAQTVTRSEMHRQSLTRIVRLIGITILCVVGIGFYVASNVMNKAEAASDDLQPVAAQLAQLNQTIGELAQGLGGLVQNPSFGKLIQNSGTLAERLKQDSDALRLLFFCKKHELAVEQCVAQIKSGQLQPSLDMQIVTMDEAPEAMAMFENLRHLQGISQTLGNELRKINELLVAIPQMRQEMAIMRHDMNMMSANMGIMAGSMDGTMGRAARWMPMPW